MYFKPAPELFRNQAVVTGSRAIGTAYQNTTGKPMMVLVTATATSASEITGLTDANATPTTEVGRGHQGTATVNGSVFFCVLNGNYYKVTVSGTSPALTRWTEWY